MIEILLGVLCVGSISMAVLLVRRKLPLLLQVPSNLIEESFLTRPSRIKTYTAPVIDYFRSRRYRQLYRSVLVWGLHRLRLSLLRFERVIFRTLEALRSEEEYLTSTEEQYWSELKQWKQEAKENGAELPHAVLASEPPPQVREKSLPKTAKTV